MSNIQTRSQLDMRSAPKIPTNVMRKIDIVNSLSEGNKTRCKYVWTLPLEFTYNYDGRYTQNTPGSTFITNLLVNDTILITGESDKRHNGIYTVKDIGDGSTTPIILERSIGFVEDDILIGGLRVYITSSNKTYKLNTEALVEVDRDNLEFIEVPVKYANVVESVNSFVGDGTKTVFSFTHNFGGKNILFSLFDPTTGALVSAKIVMVDDNNCSVELSSPLELDKELTIIMRASVDPF